MSCLRDGALVDALLPVRSRVYRESEADAWRSREEGRLGDGVRRIGVRERAFRAEVEARGPLGGECGRGGVQAW